VTSSPAGYGTGSSVEYRTTGSRGELWLPLWQQPATYTEVAHVFAEARAEVSTRQAETGSDFARAVASLGVERGISSFVRFGFLQRSGRDGIIAAPLGRYRVSDSPAVDLLLDVDGWLRRLRSATRDEKEPPEGLYRCLRQVDRAMMGLARSGSRHGGTAAASTLQQVLVALGRTESWLSRSALRSKVRPLPGLRGDWYVQADDNSPEYRIAAALASIRSNPSGVPAVRSHVEAVRVTAGSVQWSPDSPSRVWGGAHLLDDMASVAIRRCLDAARLDVEAAPFDAAVAISLEELLKFLAGQVDERRIEELVLPLSMIQWRDAGAVGDKGDLASETGDLLLPAAYATLKLLFLPWRFKSHPGAEETKIALEPRILPLLRAGRSAEAYGLACRRLRVSGLPPLVSELTFPATTARRLAAALLIPIPYPAMWQLARAALGRKAFED